MFVSTGKAVWIIAALGLLLVPAASSAAAERPCNGSVELCGRTLDQVVLPGTHNSMSAAELGWIPPNQTYSITNQLERGVRSLLFDTYYGITQPGGSVKAIGRDEGEATDARTYMCHALCQLGFVDLTTELSHIADFLEANPREVLTFVNEDYIAPEAFAKAVEQSGLLPYVYQGSAASFRTLSSMIDSGQRVVMLAQNEVGDVPWYHLGYGGPMMETPYTFNSAAELTDPNQLSESCRPNRGGEGSPLFLMNHWVTTGVSPETAKAAIVNTKAALVARARACEQRRGKLPTILAVDFYGTGDVLGAARELNGVVARPYLETTKPKAAKVKAGRKATFRMTLSNYGDVEAEFVRVCATVAARLARKPSCDLVDPIAIGGTRTARVRVFTKKTARGFGAVKVRVVSSAGTLKTSARLTVKPLRKKRVKRG